MSSTTYILNSPNSTDSIDIETTAFGCIGIHNGVATVCAYLDGLKQGRWAKGEKRTGIHIQTHPNTSPNGSWGMESGYFECTVDKAMNTITYKETSQRPTVDEVSAAAQFNEKCDVNLRPAEDS